MLRTYFVYSLLMLLFCTCESTEKELTTKDPKLVDKPIEKAEVSMRSDLIEKYAEAGLVVVDDARFLIDLRYTTANNFMHQVLYDTIDRLFLQKEVSERLSRCQDLLDSLRPGFRLKIFDGVRPLQVQKEMWEALDTIPVGLRGKFVSNPKYGSVHNFGTAVDITICDASGKELDMGAGYDDFRPIAFPSREGEFVQKGLLSSQQLKNRQLLRQVMRSQKFYNIPSEWWHFNAYSRLTCEHKFEILLNESGQHQKWVSPPLPKDTSESGAASLPLNWNEIQNTPQEQ